MKLISKINLLAIAVLTVGCTNTPYYYSAQDAVIAAKKQGIISQSTQFYFAQPAPGQVIKADVVVNRKTNAFNKTSEEACQWVMFSALKALENEAKARGSNKIGNVVSYFKKMTYTSPSQYQCYVGSIMAGVALKGDIVK